MQILEDGGKPKESIKCTAKLCRKFENLSVNLRLPILFKKQTKIIHILLNPGLDFSYCFSEIQSVNVVLNLELYEEKSKNRGRSNPGPMVENSSDGPL